MTDPESAYVKHTRRLTQLQSARTPYEPLWSKYDEFICPGRLRLVDDKAKQLETKHKSIVNESVLLAFRIYRAGMYSGMSQPSRPWFKQVAGDPDLRKSGPVKEYYFTRNERLRDVLQGTNIYNALHAGYGDDGQFGQSAMLVVGDDRHILRAIPLINGEYWVAQNHLHRVDTLYRRCPMTAEQVVGRFVYRGDPANTPDWSIVSNAVRSLWDKNKDAPVPCFQAIEPRQGRDTTQQDKRNKPFLSDYWEQGGPSGKLLEESGFDYNPIVCSRWETVGNDAYGSNHPGEVALGASRMLQQEELWKGLGIEREVDGPMQAPVSLKTFGVDLLPGGLNYVDTLSNGQNAGIKPIYENRMNLDHLSQDIDRVENRAGRIFYNDIIMAITQMEGIQPKNVFELTQRKEEQMQQFGPVIERQQYEKLNPLIEIASFLCDRAGLFPPAPPELKNQIRIIEHISVMAQAQKAIAVGSIERLASFAGNLAAAKPDVLDNLDLDDAVQSYAEDIGAPPSMMVAPEKVQELRAQRAQQQQAMDQANMAATMAPAAAQGAQAAKLLAETGQLTGNSKLPPANEILSKLGIAG